MQVVFGANGKVGGETARALLQAGEPVRVVLRRREQGEPWARLGADVAAADLRDGDQVAAALDGASGAFVLNPTPTTGDPFASAHEVGNTLAQALRRAQTPKAVVLSSVGAQHRSGTGVVATLNQIEAMLDGATPAIAFLRSGYFVETWSEVAGAAMAEGVLPSFIDPAQKIPMVSTIDVGRTASALLREDWTGKRILELSGPEDWSAGDVAAAFAAALDRDVEPLFVPPKERAAMLAAEGMDDKAVTAFLGMYEGIADNLLVREDRHEQRRGSVQLNDAVRRIVSSIRVA